MESDSNLTDAMEDISLEICDDNCLNQWWGFWIEGVAVPAIAVFGIIGIAYIKLAFRIQRGGFLHFDYNLTLLGMVTGVNITDKKEYRREFKTKGKF